MKKTRRVSEFPNLPDVLSGLEELAENLWWSWHPSARLLFKMLDRQAWKESIHNPDKMLKELPAKVLQRAAEDVDYKRHYQFVLSRFRNPLAPNIDLASNSVISPASFELRLDVSKSETDFAPDLLSLNDCQKELFPIPIGDMIPTPVMAILFSPMK